MTYQNNDAVIPEPVAEGQFADARTKAKSIEQATIDMAIEDGPAAKSGAKQEETRIGRVVSVSGSQVMILLEDISLGGERGTVAKLQIGALVKMYTDSTIVFGMVSGLSIPIPSQNPEEFEMCMVELELIGEAFKSEDGSKETFQRGISFCPALGHAVYTSTQEDLKQVYARPSVPSVQIGTIYQDQSLPAFVATDDLLGKHFAVLGTTGCGKSCAVALILRSILEQHGSGHVLLLDIHNEYSRVFGETAETLGPGSLELPYWMLNFEEIREIIIGVDRDNREEDTVILKKSILEARRRYHRASDTDDYVTADTPTPYRLSDLIQQIDEALGNLDKPSDSAPYLRLKERLSTLQSDKRYSFMFQGLAVRDNMAAIVSRIFRLPVAGKPITILDLSGVPSEILNVVISLLCRLTFDFALWSERALPVLLVCEEAHRYVTEDTSQGFNATKRILGHIAKEGRKYGVSLCLVSQRPSDLAVGILSQCNTIFAMRMSNQNDQDFVSGALSESAMGLIDSLPTLRTGEAIVVGEGVSVPVRVRFDTLGEERKPLSGTASFSTVWQNDDKDESFAKEIIEKWRRQRR